MILKQIFEAVFPKESVNKSLRILITVDTVMVFIMGLLIPFYAVFVQKVGGSLVFAGFSWAVFSIIAGILTLLFSKWELRVKEQELLFALGYVIRGMVFLSYAFMGSLPQLIFTQVLWGVGVAIGVPAFNAVYSSHTSKENSIVDWGRWVGISSIATGVAAIFGGLLIQSIGYLPVFLGMSLFSFALGVYVWRLPRELL